MNDLVALSLFDVSCVWKFPLNLHSTSEDGGGDCREYVASASRISVAAAVRLS